MDVECQKLKQEAGQRLKTLYTFLRDNMVTTIKRMITLHLNSIHNIDSEALVIKDVVHLAENIVADKFVVTEDDMRIVYPLLTFKHKNGEFYRNLSTFSRLGINTPIIAYIMDTFAKENLTVHNISNADRSSKIFLQVVFKKNAVVIPDPRPVKRQRLRSESPTSPSYSPGPREY